MTSQIYASTMCIPFYELKLRKMQNKTKRRIANITIPLLWRVLLVEDSFGKVHHIETATIIQLWERFGGSFVKSLAVALQRADPVNTYKLLDTFSNYISEYLEVFYFPTFAENGETEEIQPSHQG